MSSPQQTCCPDLRSTLRLTPSVQPGRWSASPFDGTLSIPDYELLKKIGHGSYGSVWLARSVTGIFRAVKVVYRARFGDDEPYEREFRGLKEFAAVSAEAGTLLGVLHVGKNDAAGFFYYVMELADDISTGRQVDPARYVPKTLDQVRRQQGRLPAGMALELGVALASALAALHDHGLVHRDVKPSNIIFVGDRPKFADIGLVRSATAAEESPSLVGNTAYMPADLPGDFSADVFGLGKILYELSTGRNHKDFPRLPPDLGASPDRAALLELNEIVLQACAPHPASRFSDACALLEKLRCLQAGRSVRRGRSARRLLGRLRFAAGAAIAGVLAALLAMWGRVRVELLRAQRSKA